MAMTLEQMQKLPAVQLLNERIDAVFNRCGFPIRIEDLAASDAPKRSFVWRERPISLSAGEWKVTYSSVNEGSPSLAETAPGTAPPRTCVRGASRLVLLAREVGVIVRTKKPAGYGYLTRYQIPSDPLHAHKVLRIDVSVIPALSVITITKRYGEPDEIMASKAGAHIMRYWVVVRDKIHSPRNAFAVDFRIDLKTKHCVGFSVDTDSIEFVAKRLEHLQGQWERAFVLD
ncbi:MAG: hypothetical protein AMS22_03860 [Thiotrichales bacterium SG8_50]|jgi:hypothetical protein|nr:MAG: hypothetical protein AMS22_03860 [Thiotrichales bacterium SG8_50]